jgi:hypothetical protein
MTDDKKRLPVGAGQGYASATESNIRCGTTFLRFPGMSMVREIEREGDWDSTGGEILRERRVTDESESCYTTRSVGVD